ncbi:dTDP-6-deoxy-L-talose 4-dehydrogenase (NAD+) [Phyllobacterium sp. CL33Tsu]|uniref:NAD-dependent epimerase/dehydratase family protein n=1 Tax=Phyllobacterium sp. CL33Tsu TaxID=1798191 RepID=UPI0008ED8CF6|nr:NAD(P)-dependent oxidoreductase [Phyllobacterium sp. CL33Tsu]SFJ55389.1 dTDP-6-deoxy-L-talose 4-dehydrogenase (NAD+) [Phyllobacterium sp. CL33Tsu]
MRYLVTGGCGYVGQHVVSALISRGHEVVVASRTVSGGAVGAEYLQLDILNDNRNLYEISGKPDVLIRLAWEDGFNHASSKHLSNLPQHVTFLRRMLEAGLKHIVGVGTMHEVGYHIGPVDEATPTFPLHAYGIAKNYLRSVQTLMCKEFGAVDQWIRCYYIYGDDMLNNSIFTKLLRAEAEGKTEFPLNTGELLYDFIHVNELGLQVADVSEQASVIGIVNCCSGEPVTLKTMVLRFIEENHLHIKPVWGAFPMRPYDSRALWGDPAKIQRVRELRLGS